MDFLIHKILEWAEAWAVLIPLSIILIYKPAGKNIRPLILLVWLALIFNTLIVIIGDYQKALPGFLRNNNLYYNLFSIVKVLTLGFYLTKSDLLRSKRWIQLIIPLYLILILYIFLFRESILEHTPTSGAVESITLLTICIAYFLLSILDDSDTIWMDQPSFFLCMAVSFYEATTFFTFLFVIPIYNYNKAFGLITMKIFSMCFAVFFVLLAIFLYRHRTNKPSILKPITTGNI